MTRVYKATPNISDTPFDMDGVVLHLTAGAFDGAVEWLCMSPEERERITGTLSYSSAHVVFSRLGDRTQLAPFDKMTWHAGRIASPTERGKAAMKKKLIGWENPNKHMLGYEFAGGYDIDRDGIVEGWEKLYTVYQIKEAVLFHLEVEEFLGREIPDYKIVTHADITAGKINLDIPRMMFLAELKKQRSLSKATEPVVLPEPEIIITGNRYEISSESDISFKKL